MKHERTFGSLQRDGITSKNYFPPKNSKFLFWWDFSKMPNRVEKKKNHWLPTMQWSDIFVIDCFVWEKKKKWPTIIHTRWTTRKVWRQKHTVMCVQFELKKKSLSMKNWALTTWLQVPGNSQAGIQSYSSRRKTTSYGSCWPTVVTNDRLLSFLSVLKKYHVNHVLKKIGVRLTDTRQGVETRPKPHTNHDW